MTTKRTRLLAPILLALAAVTPRAGAVEAAGLTALTVLTVSPAEVHLATARARQTFVVPAGYADGITRDVTGQAKAALGNPAVAKLEKNVVLPVADGATELKVEFGGKSVAVKVLVKDAKKDRPVSFKLDVMPIFMRAGCNQGSCH